MNKAEMASYLVSLHSLIEAQTKGSHSISSTTLAEEYEKHWDLLKETIQKENTNEARQSNSQRAAGSEARTSIDRREPRSGEPDRLPRGAGSSGGADVSRPRVPGPDEG